jgi:hypothetical protein
MFVCLSPPTVVYSVSIMCPLIHGKVESFIFTYTTFTFNCMTKLCELHSLCRIVGVQHWRVVKLLQNLVDTLQIRAILSMMKHFNIFCYIKWKPHYNRTPEILFISTSHLTKYIFPYIWAKNKMCLPLSR